VLGREILSSRTYKRRVPLATSKFPSFCGREFAAAAVAVAVNMVQKAISPFVLAFSVVERRTQGSTIYLWR
jgi:hypothetical protein